MRRRRQPGRPVAQASRLWVARNHPQARRLCYGPAALIACELAAWSALGAKGRVAGRPSQGGSPVPGDPSTPLAGGGVTRVRRRKSGSDNAFRRRELSATPADGGGVVERRSEG